MRWSADGKRLLYALHTLAWRKAVQDSFAVMTAGPVFVQSSDNSFLTWDALRRAANVRSIVAYDLPSGKTIELLPETMVASWDASEDASTLTYSEDITKKTDYDVIFGSENKLMARALACPAAPDACGKSRVLLPTLKGTNIVWSEDGGHYAYAKEGRVYVATLNDTAARQVAGPAAETRRDVPPDSSRDARERRERERFRVVRYSPANDALVVANSQDKEEALAGLERWKKKHRSVAKYLAVDDVLVDSMRGRSSTWTRIRVNLRNVPENIRPPQQTPDPDDDPTRAWREARTKR